MDYKAIINLIKIDQTDLTRLEIEEEGLRIYLKRKWNPSTYSCSASGFPGELPILL